MIALVSIVLAPDAAAQTGERSGKDVVDAVCAKCHVSGEQGAPKIGDQQAWLTRAEQGLGGLTQNAVSGVRKMPAHGGSQKLTDLDIGRAITYMVNQSGGVWTEPASAKEIAALRTGQQVAQAQCNKCHQTGVGGAPRIGDREAWIPRLKRGLDQTVRSAISGHGGMPPRGDKADLTDGEIRNAILYMYNPKAAARIEPWGAKDVSGTLTGQQVVQAQCYKCHQDGLHGAPRIGDRAAWVPRLKQGVEHAVRSAIRGHGGMPPRGDRADLTDTEIRSAVLYMYNPGAAAKGSVSTPGGK
ncbi:MAG: c-type cytochrome [Burkholderiales bacterium]